MREAVKQYMLTVVRLATDDSHGIGRVVQALDGHIGTTDWLGIALGKGAPERSEECFLGVGNAFAALDPDTLAPRIICALLTGTNPVKTRIPGRPEFYERCWESLEKRKGCDVDGMLRGLK